MVSTPSEPSVLSEVLDAGSICSEVAGSKLTPRIRIGGDTSVSNSDRASLADGTFSEFRKWRNLSGAPAARTPLTNRPIR